jgi:hypothetical protein
MKFQYIFPILFFLMSTSAFGADSYLCKSDRMTGFVFDEDNKSWQQSSMKETRQYIVKKVKEGSQEKKICDNIMRGKKIHWIVAEVGDSFPFAFCQQDINEQGNLVCNYATGDLYLNTNNMKFSNTYAIGYLTGRAGAKLSSHVVEKTQNMEYGKCSPLDEYQANSNQSKKTTVAAGDNNISLAQN